MGKINLWLTSDRFISTQNSLRILPYPNLFFTFLLIWILFDYHPTESRFERSQALDAGFKALHTWSKTKKAEKRKDDSDDNLSDDEQLAPKKSRKGRRGSDALKFLQEQSEKEEERKQEEMTHRREMAAIEMKRQDLLQQELQIQQQQIEQMQTMMLAIVSKMSQP